MTLNTGHIFSGSGGGLLADLILGHNPIEAVDFDEKCCQNLILQKEWFPNLEVHCEDISKFNASNWKGRVDILHAGIPCPRWSAAKRGIGDLYDGWDDTLRIIKQFRPKISFFECVANFRKEHPRLKKDLFKIGYGLIGPLINDAASMGAPHSRKRYWSLGYSYDEGKSMLKNNAEVAFMPPSDCGIWWETPPVPTGVDDGLADRVYRFKATGNGQVPLQAAAAYIVLGGPIS